MQKKKENPCFSLSHILQTLVDAFYYLIKLSCEAKQWDSVISYPCDENQSQVKDSQGLEQSGVSPTYY